MKILLILLTLFMPGYVNAAAIAISLNCKATSYIICDKRCQLIDQNLPRLIIDVGNSKIDRKTEKTIKLEITNIQKIDESHSTLMSYKILVKNSDEIKIDGFINIDKFQNFTSTMHNKASTWISAGKCKQK
jgi:hypothetical protein